MAQRRVSHLSFNFDSLTDLVTNLAGALIMIVLLFFGLSSERVKRAATAASMGNAGRGEGHAGHALNVPALLVETKAIEDQLKKRQNEIEKIRAEVAKIDRTAARMQPREFADPEGKAGEPELVDLRPPMLSKTNKSTGALFLLMRNRLFFVGLADAAEAQAKFTAKFKDNAREAVRTGADLKTIEAVEVQTLPSGDFNLRCRVSNVVKSPNGEISGMVDFSLVVKAEAKGETAEQAITPESHYRNIIGQLNSQEQTIGYGVYADSFPLFRTVRDFILDRKFNYNWNPMPVGAEAFLGSGGGVQ
jgi:hypothetical protein